MSRSYAPSYVNESERSFTASGAIAERTLVKLASDNTVAAAATHSTDKPIGVALSNAADGDNVTVKLLNGDGTVLVVANGAVVIGTTLFGCDSGKVNDTDPGSAVKVGIALNAAAADGDIIEMIPVLVLA